MPLRRRFITGKLICAWLSHWPALVTEPCRCRRCGRMICWTRESDGGPGAGWRALEGKQQ